MSNNIISVTCSTCRLEVEWNDNNPFRPFCSKRCQLIDLGKWIEEEKCISNDRQIKNNKN